MDAKIYKAGSLVFFKGEKAEKIYLLKSGVACSLFISSDTGREDSEDLKIGEFFGIVSVFGNSYQNDTVQCITDCSIIVLSMVEFEFLVSKNPEIIIKILKTFSKDLRTINEKKNFLVNDNVSKPTQAEGFLSMGDFYYDNANFDHALYAYEKFLSVEDEKLPSYEMIQNRIVECQKALK